MRVLVLSDIHSNIIALDTVLKDAGSYDQVWCLGDLVGYGPNPNECIDRVKGLAGLQCILGNHDAAALGKINVRAFNYEAQVSLKWLTNVLEPGHKRFLERLDEKKTFGNITLAHGSPRNPVWEYIMDVRLAKQNFNAFETQICLVGHTHIPCLFTEDDTGEVKLCFHLPGESFKIKYRAIINPGSVGQPRDHDPRASYLIYDSDDDIWEFRRVAYDYMEVRERIIRAGLPSNHALRLRNGL